PPPSEREKVTLDQFVQFIDANGCLEYAEKVGTFVGEEILPEIPCLLGVDHSLSGGVFKKLSEYYGPDYITLVILDSHTDALPVSLMAGAVQYDMETNPGSLHDPNDPYLVNRPDSYNASSFLNHLLSEGILLPHNLYVLGIGDYPPKQAFRIKDPRIEKLVGYFLKLKKQGVTLLTKNDLLISPSKTKSVLKQIHTPWVYISIDLDIGARNALEGVRFLDRQGLNGPQLLRLVGYLRDVLNRGIGLAGFDLCEINPRTAGQDQTYRIAVDVIKKLVWSL
ncbi:MAG: arginase family protein, partial [Thermodesulfobacteriota bacterium]